jgi:phosphoenolpyruvate carboxylase
LHNAEFSVHAADEPLMIEYAALVEDPALRERILKPILDEYRLARDVLDKLFRRERSEKRPRLMKAVDIRRHALLRLHREQIALLRAWRGPNRSEEILSRLLVTVNAIAGGLKTTG